MESRPRVRVRRVGFGKSQGDVVTSIEPESGWTERLNPRNWTLSWKLAVVGLVPALLALALGVMRIADDAEQASELSRSSRLVEVRDQVAGAANALRQERDESTLVRRGRPDRRPQRAADRLRPGRRRDQRDAGRVARHRRAGRGNGSGAAAGRGLVGPARRAPDGRDRQPRRAVGPGRQPLRRGHRADRRAGQGRTPPAAHPGHRRARRRHHGRHRRCRATLGRTHRGGRGHPFGHRAAG